MSSHRKRIRSDLELPSTDFPSNKRHGRREQFQRDPCHGPYSQDQQVLLLKAIKCPYEIAPNHRVPEINQPNEMLIKVKAAGINPIDWKAPDFNFGIPALPYIAGRELVGTVVKASALENTRIHQGDIVIVPSTDYRDQRKAAFQNYCIASCSNAIRLPRGISVNSGSILGVAFVSAALTLGICMGLNFQNIENGPDLLTMVRNMEPESLPLDIREECSNGISHIERAKRGDFLVIWGGNSTCAFVAQQIAHLGGLRIITVVDKAKHGLKLSTSETARPDLIVDSHDPERAIDIIKASSCGQARFGFDTLGKESAGYLMRALADPIEAPSFLSKDVNYSKQSARKLPTPPATPLDTRARLQRSHLVGLTGLPKAAILPHVASHNVPIKLFHEVPEIGESLSIWCERLLVEGLLVPPDVVGTVDGLSGINAGLDRMRRREIRGGRLVAVLE